MSTWADVFRFLQEEGNDDVAGSFGVDVYTVGRPSDDGIESEWDDDDEYYLEPWGWTLVTVAGAFIISACVFYFTYKYQCCGAKEPDEDALGDLDLESGTKIATKTFGESSSGAPQHHHNLQSGGSEATEPSDATAPVAGVESAYNNFQHLAATPRCVLCSKPFQIGEDVTQSTACDHEYHEDCLVKYWKKSKENNSKCPVCKKEYMVDELAPSKQFSPSSRRMSSSERAPEPFDA